MTLNGGKLILLGKKGQVDKILETKEKKFRIGYYMSCDFIHEHPDVEGIHCEIACDPFGRISIRNFSLENPIIVNGSIVKGLRPLLNGNIIEVLGKQFRWMYGMGSSLETPVRKESKSEQAPKSEPSSKEQKLIQRRLTVHSFAYGLQTQFEDTVEVPNVQYPENGNIENKNEKMECTDKFKQSIKVRKSVSSTDDIATTPQYTSENLENTLNFSKVSEIDMEKETSQIKLSLCYQSEIVVTSYSPCTPSSRSIQSFAYITPIKTPRSLYSTPKGALSEFNVSGDDKGDMIDFKTPGTVKCGKSSMHLIDLTTPLKLKTPKRVQSSSLIKSALKNSAKTAIKSVTKQHSVSTQRNSKPKINKSTPVAAVRNLSMSMTPKRKFCVEPSETFKNKTLPAVTVSESNKGQFFLDNTEAANNFPQITLDSSCASTVNVDSTGITDGSVIEISTDEISNLSVEHRKTPVSIKSTANKLMRKAIMTSARKIFTNPDANSSKVNSKLNQSAKISCSKGAPLRKGGSPGVLNLSSQKIDRKNNLASISLNLGRSTPKRLTFTNSATLSTSTPLKIRKSTSVTPLKIRNKGEFSGNYKAHSCIDLNQTAKKLSRTLRKSCANTDKKNLKSVNKSIPFTNKLISSTDVVIQTVQDFNSTFIVESDRSFSEEHHNIKEKDESADNSKIHCQEESDNITNIFDENNETTETKGKCEIEDNVANRKVVQFEYEDKTQKYRQDDLKIQENQVTDVNKPCNLPEESLSNLKGIKEFHTIKENPAPLLLHSSKIDGKVVDNNSIGIKDLLKTPSSSKNSTADLRRSNELKKTSKTALTLTDNFVGIKELMKTPKKFDNIEDNFIGLKELVKTPRAFKSDDALVGNDYIFMTPIKDEITDEQKIEVSDFKNNKNSTQSSQICNFNKDIEDESTFKTPSAKMAMVLGTPECINVNKESNSEGLIGPIIYDFRENMEELEDIFQTPGVPELSEVMEERVNEYETLTAEECFDKLANRPCVKRSYSRKSVSPKEACALVQSTVKAKNDLPMTDVQEWVDKIDHSLDSKDDLLKEAKENDKNISKDEMINDNDELATGDVSGINFLESTNGSVFSCSLVYSDDELSGFDNFSSVPRLNRKRSKSCISKTSLNNTGKRSSIRQQELRKYRQSVDSKPFNQENGKENKITVECQYESHENSNKTKYLNIPFYQERENKNDMSKGNFASNIIDKSSLYLGADEIGELDTAFENVTNKSVRRKGTGKSFCEIKHKHLTKLHRKSLGDNTHNVSLDVGGEREGLEVEGEKEELELDREKEGLEIEGEKVRIEVDDVLKNVNESALRSMNGRSAINETVYKDALISPKGRTMGNETFYMSFDLEAERERYEMERDFEDFCNIPPKKRSRGKSVGEFSSKNIFTKSRKTTGDETKDISFYTEIEKGRIEIEEAFKNFSERPTTRGKRNNKSVCEPTLKSALKNVRKTMHNSKQDISFDIEIEKERIEIEKAFENFDEKSTNRRLRSKSINISEGRRELKKTRNTMGDALEDVLSFDIESEKERFEREQDFVQFVRNPTVRSVRGRSAVEARESKDSVYKGNLARNRKTMGNLSNDVSFDIETEKQRIEKEEDFAHFEKNTIARNNRGRSVMESKDKNALSQNRKTMGSLVNDVSFDIEIEKKRIEREEDFAHFENNPVTRCTRGRSVMEFYESIDKDTLTQNRKTMGILPNEVTFDVETEKERVNTEKEFEDFDKKSTDRGKRGRSVHTFTSKKTLMKPRKTLGDDCQNVSFELDIEKERLELEKDFAHFDKNSTVKSIRGRSVIETRESNDMCEDNLVQNRRTMGNLANDVSFDVESEKQRIEREEDFAHFEKNTIARNTRGRSVMESTDKNTLAGNRKTMGNLVNDVSFDIETEKRRMEKEEDFAHFEKNPVIRNTRGRSVLEYIASMDKGTLNRNRKTMGDSPNEVTFDVETEKERVDTEKEFENFDKKSTDRGKKGRSVLTFTSKKTSMKPRKTLGYDCQNVSFELDIEKERLELEKDFAHFDNNPTVRRIRGRSVIETRESNEYMCEDNLVQNRRTMGNLANDVSFDVESEKQRIEREEDFAHFEKNTIARNTRGRSVMESTDKNTMAGNRKTMGNLVNDVSFDIETEKRRIEKEEDFAHFEKNPVIRNTRRRSVLEYIASMDKGTLNRNRKTMGDLPNEVTFDVETEKERVDTEKEFENFDKKSTDRGKKGRSVLTFTSKKTSMKPRKTLGYDCQNVSFELDIEKERLELEKDFAHFDNNPTVRRIRGRSVIETRESNEYMCEDNLVQNRRTMGNLANDVSFDVESEKQRIEREEDFAHFEKNTIARNTRGRSVMESTDKNTLAGNRKTMGNLVNDVSFDIETEKRRIEKEEDFAHFEKNPVIRNTRGRSVLEYIASMDKDTLNRNRKTMGALPNDTAFDVETEKERVDTQKKIEHFDQKPVHTFTPRKTLVTPRNIMEFDPQNVSLDLNIVGIEKIFKNFNKSPTTTDKTNQSENKFNLKSSTPKTPRKTLGHGHAPQDDTTTQEKVEMENAFGNITPKNTASNALQNVPEDDVKKTDELNGKDLNVRTKQCEILSSANIQESLCKNEILRNQIVEIKTGEKLKYAKSAEKDEESTRETEVPCTRSKKVSDKQFDKFESVSKEEEIKNHSENELINAKKTLQQGKKKVIRKEKENINDDEKEKCDYFVVKKESSNTPNNLVLMLETVKSKRDRKRNIELGKEIPISKDDVSATLKTEPVENSDLHIKPDVRKEVNSLELIGKLRGRGRKVKAVENNYEEIVAANEPDRKVETSTRRGRKKKNEIEKEIPVQKEMTASSKIDMNEPDRKVEPSTRRGRKKKNEIEEEMPVQKEMTASSEIDMNEPDRKVQTSTRRGRNKKNEIEEEMPVQKEMTASSEIDTNIYELDRKVEFVGKETSTRRERNKKNEIEEEMPVQKEVIASSEIDMNEPDRKVQTSTRRGRNKKNEIEEEMPVQKEMIASSEIDMNEPDRKVQTSTRRGRKKINEIEEEMPVQKEMTASSEIDTNIYELDRKVEFVDKQTSTRRGRNKKNEIEEEMPVQKEVIASSEIDMNEPDRKVQTSTRRGRKKINEIEEEMPVQKEMTASSEIDTNIYELDRKVEFVGKETSTRRERNKKNEIEEEMPVQKEVIASSEIDMNEPDRKVQTSTRRGRNKKNEIEEEMPVQKEMIASSEIDMNEPDRKVQTSTRRGRNKKNEIEEEMPVQKEMIASSEIDMNEPDRKVQTSTRRGRKKINEIEEEMPVQKEMTASSEIDTNIYELDRKVEFVDKQTSTRRGRNKKNEIEEEMPVQKEVIASSEIDMNEPDRKVQTSTRRGRKKINEIEEEMPVQKEMTASSEIDTNIYELDRKVEFVDKQTSTRRGRNKKNEIEEEMRIQKEMTASSEIDMKNYEVETVQKKSQSNRIRRQAKVNRVTKGMHEDATTTLEIPLLNLQALEDKEEQVKRATIQKIGMKEVASLEFPAIQSLRPRRGNQEKTAVSQAKTEALNEEIDKESPTNIRVTRKRRRNKNELTTSCETIEKEILINSQLSSMSETESQVIPKTTRVIKLSTMENIDHTNLSARISDKNNAKKDAIPSRSKNIYKAKNILETSTDDLTSVKIISKTLLERNKNSTPSIERNNIVEFKTPINVIPRARRCLRSNSTHTSTPVLSEEQFSLKDDLSEINESGNEKNKSKTGIAKGRRRILTQEIDTDDESSKDIAGRTRTWRRKKEVDIDLSKKKLKLEAKSSGFQTEENERNTERKPKKTPTKTNKNKENKANQPEVLMNSEKMAPTRSTLGKRKAVQTETEEVTTIRTTRSRKK